MVACRLITSGDSGVNLVISRVLRSCFARWEVSTFFSDDGIAANATLSSDISFFWNEADETPDWCCIYWRRKKQYTDWEKTFHFSSHLTNISIKWITWQNTSLLFYDVQFLFLKLTREVNWVTCRSQSLKIYKMQREKPIVKWMQWWDFCLTWGLRNTNFETHCRMSSLEFVWSFEFSFFLTLQKKKLEIPK